ncbi:TPA: cysteine-rich KTR domain-containing protein [Streptococcus suis]
MKCEWILCPVCGSKTRNKIRKPIVTIGMFMNTSQTTQSNSRAFKSGKKSRFRQVMERK